MEAFRDLSIVNRAILFRIYSMTNGAEGKRFPYGLLAKRYPNGPKFCHTFWRWDGEQLREGDIQKQGLRVEFSYLFDCGYLTGHHPMLRDPPPTYYATLTDLGRLAVEWLSLGEAEQEPDPFQRFAFIME